MKFIITALISLFFCFTLSAQTDGNKSQLENLLSSADSIFNSRQYAKSRDVYLQVAEKAVQSKNNSILTEAYSMISRTYLILNDKKSGIIWITRANEIANNDEPSGWSRYLGVRGRFEWQDKQLEKAAQTFEEMYNYCSKQKLHIRAIDAAHMMAIVSDLSGQVKWAKKGIAEAEAGDIGEWLGPLWNNLGTTYEDLGNYKEAIKAFLNAREYHYKHGTETNKMIADWAVGHAYRLNGDFPNALIWIRPIIEWAVRLKNVEFVGWANNELGEIELAKGNLQPALDYLGKAVNYLKQAKMESWDPEGFQKQLAKIQMIQNRMK